MNFLYKTHQLNYTGLCLPGGKFYHLKVRKSRSKFYHLKNYRSLAWSAWTLLKIIRKITLPNRAQLSLQIFIINHKAYLAICDISDKIVCYFREIHYPSHLWRDSTATPNPTSFQICLQYHETPAAAVHFSSATAEMFAFRNHNSFAL